MTYSLVKPFGPPLYGLYAVMVIYPDLPIAVYTSFVSLCVYIFIEGFIQGYAKAATKVIFSNRVVV